MATGLVAAIPPAFVLSFKRAVVELNYTLLNQHQRAPTLSEEPPEEKTVKTKLAPIITMLGILTALLFATAGTAQATGPDFTCGNVVVVQVCDNDIDVPVDIDVTISSSRALTGNEITVLETTLKDVVDADVTKNDIKVAVINLYTGDFNITILSGNVIVIGDIPCGC